MKYFLYLAFALVISFSGSAQKLKYPYPVRYIQLQIEQRKIRMAYMDINPAKPNGSTVILFHGKNFNGYYWKDVIRFLTDQGYRVIVPDQVGWGKSDKPNIHYSFHLLSENTKKLLDTLGIKKVNVIAHSMGGMLATRFALMYPEMVDKLIYENPIGLEDYKTFVPYHSIDVQYASELKASFESLKKYQQSYYPEWKPEYDQYVMAQYEALHNGDFKAATLASAITYEMIYEQPVVYEFKYITQPTLMIIGQADRTIVGKNLLSKEVASQHGLYPQLGRKFHEQVKNSTLVELEGVGHIPHVQAYEAFKKNVLDFLAK